MSKRLECRREAESGSGYRSHRCGAPRHGWPNAGEDRSSRAARETARAPEGDASRRHPRAWTAPQREVNGVTVEVTGGVASADGAWNRLSR